jgi:hypothetical protein
MPLYEPKYKTIMEAFDMEVVKGNVLPKTPAKDSPKYVQRMEQKTRKALYKLDEIGFDPIEELVRTYVKVYKEIRYYEDWRDGRIVPLTASGKARIYSGSSELAHSNLHDKLIKISTELLRYKYGRIPEGINFEPNGAPPLTINLSSDQKSYEILVNNGEDIIDNEDEPD